jgi:hypothetical protein
LDDHRQTGYGRALSQEKDGQEEESHDPYLAGPVRGESLNPGLVLLQTMIHIIHCYSSSSAAQFTNIVAVKATQGAILYWAIDAIDCTDD